LVAAIDGQLIRFRQEVADLLGMDQDRAHEGDDNTSPQFGD
jgi:hypothetical protein